MEKKIREFLNTKLLAKDIKYIEKVESTQTEAKKLAEQGTENGTLVITNNQTNGMGTQNRKWISSEGKNITFTLILYPKCKLTALDSLTIDIAKCLVDSISSLYGYELYIKSPNDIMYNNKKMGGILTQVVTSGEKIKYLLIGIGMNINEINFPNEIKDIATSMAMEFKSIFSREEIIGEFLNRFEKYCEEKGIV